MKRILIFITAMISAVIVGFAQYGETVREDRIWNYTINHYRDSDTVPGPYKTESAPGYHFDGKKTINGIEYAIFRNGNNEAINYLREQERKIYQISCDEDEATRFGEIILYDFGQDPGDLFQTPAYTGYSQFEELGNLVDMVAVHCENLEIRGMDRLVQVWDYPESPGL